MVLNRIFIVGPYSSSFRCRTDTPAELELVRQEALAAGADAAVISNHWAKGGAGAVGLANAVVQACEGESKFKFLYELDKSIEEKITIISKEIYGADGIELSEQAQKQVETYTRQGYGGLPSEYYRSCFEIRGSHKVICSLHGEDAILVLT